MRCSALLIITVALVTGTGGQVWLSAAESHVVRKQDIAFEHHLQCVVKASETTPVKSTVSWRPVKFVVPDGSFAEKGQRIVEFDPLEMQQKYEQMLLRKNVVDLELQGKLLNIDEKSRAIADQIKEKEGQLRVLRARLKRLRSLPLPADIKVAAGRLRIARLELEAAETDWDKAQQRFKNKFLSETELQSYAYALERKQASFELRKIQHRLAQQPARPWDLETVELQIKNNELNLKKLRFERDKQQDFIEISRKAAEKDVRRFERRLKEEKEELDELIIYSPVDGYIVYTDRFKRDLAENGGKMWRRRTFINIPHIDGLFVHGIISEHLRPYIEKGDRCDIYIPGAQGTYIQGEIRSIANQPSDIKDVNERARWGDQDHTSGIKVYELEILPLGDMPGGLRPQAHVKVVIHGQNRQIPAIPSQYVTSRDGAYYVSRDGIYEQVSGTPINGWFHLNDDHLLGAAIQLKGRFPLTDQSRQSVNADNESGRLVVTGEISAVRQTPVRVRRIGRSAKVTDLVEEGAEVEEGDLLLTLDDSEAKEALTNDEEQLKDAVAEREKVEEEVNINLRNGRINLRIAENNMRIAELALIALRESGNESDIAQAQLNYTNASINKRESESRLKRLQALPDDRVSKTEMLRAERDFKRKQLQYERSEIQLKLSKVPYDYYNFKKAELALFEKKLAVENLEKRLAYDEEIGQGRLLRVRNREQHRRERYEKQLQVLENLKVLAPVAGVVEHNVIYDSGTVGKVKKGSTVRRFLSPMTISDFSETMVRLEVPEQAYPYIERGGTVKVLLPSLSDAEFQGEVADIGFLFENKQRKDIALGMYANREPLGQAVFEVKIKIHAENNERLKPGMQVQVEFPLQWPIQDEAEHAQ